MPLDFTALCKRTSWETPEPSPICDERRVHPVVMKFGGSALNGPEQVATCVELVRKALGERPIVVVSAMGKATDALLEAGRRALETGAEESVAQLRAFHEAILQKFGVPFALLEPLFGELERLLQGLALVQEMSGRSRDLLVSFGERLSARTFAAAFNASNAEGIEARALDAWEVGMKTTSGSGDADSAYSSVEVLPSAYGEIKQSFAALKLCYDYVPVVTGYIAQDAHGAITTLGRDGSDLTAAVIGAAVKAKERCSSGRTCVASKASTPAWSRRPGRWRCSPLRRPRSSPSSERGWCTPAPCCPRGWPACPCASAASWPRTFRAPASCGTWSFHALGRWRPSAVSRTSP
ncbi:unnamed protein product [Effrenium voratum]|nr:unnamed protein product [Effrenium voratum]